MSKSLLKVIALDFDGTLVESNHIKDNAFKTIFSAWPDHLDTMMEWHLSHNTIDRREKFRYFVEEILKQVGEKILINELTDKFSILTREAIIECPLVNGVQEFLDDCIGKVPLFMVSASPQDELEIILKERQLEGYFQGTYGAPIDKYKVLKKIMTSKNVSKNEILYIGDSPEDQKAALMLGIQFISRKSDRQLNDFGDICLDFAEIKEHISQRYEFR